MIKNLRIGDTASITKIITQEHVEQFAEISNDRNPIHLDDTFAKTTIFGRRVAHGMLVAGLFSGLLGQTLPGEGTIYLGQTLKFVKPVFIGDEVTASVEITNIREDKPIITLKTVCTNHDGEVVIDGEAVVRV